MTLGEAAIIAILSSLPATLAPARRCDQSPILAIWRKHTVEAGEVDPWLRHQGCQPRNEVQRLEDYMSSPIAKWGLELVAHLAGGRYGETLFCNGRPGDVATEAYWPLRPSASNESTALNSANSVFILS